MCKYTDIQFVGKATPSCTSVSGPEISKIPCGRALDQHQPHILITEPSNERWSSMFKSQVSFHACGILTTEDAENLEIACGRGTKNRSMTCSVLNELVMKRLQLSNIEMKTSKLPQVCSIIGTLYVS